MRSQIGIDDDNNGINYIKALEASVHSRNLLNVELMLIKPWGSFTHALNVALAHAVDNRFDIIGYQVTFI